MIFLGQASNYRGRRIWRHLFAHGSAADSRRLRQTRARRYGATPPADVQLYHTGRAALAAAIQRLVPAGSPVIVPGLTCIAVIRAIKAADCTPVYVDIDPATLQYDLAALARTLKQLSASGKTPKLDKSDKVCYTGIVMAQNTLGRSLAMGKIQPLADAAHFAIVEDLAHSAGRFYPDGREIGTVSAAAVLSFGKGKSIDTIEGGAAILRRTAFPVAQPHVTSKSATPQSFAASSTPAAPLQPLAQPTSPAAPTSSVIAGIRCSAGWPAASTTSVSAASSSALSIACIGWLVPPMLCLTPTKSSPTGRPNSPSRSSPLFPPLRSANTTSSKTAPPSSNLSPAPAIN